MKYDLHSHSTASDGSLSPQTMLHRAQEWLVELYALTDHDTLQGVDQIVQLDTGNLRLIPGVELSSLWRGVNIHVVGLNIALDDQLFRERLANQGNSRGSRAQVIAERLAKKGMPDTLEGALAINGGRLDNIGRVHFAQYLHEQGYVNSVQQAFDRWLGSGKIGDVKQCWPEMADAVHWIEQAGGIAVLAHPLKYNFTTTKLKALIDDFKLAGGQAMEVVGAGQNPQQLGHLATLAEQYELAASGGSDFHQPGTGWCELGQIQPIPKKCQPVWQLFESAL